MIYDFDELSFQIMTVTRVSHQEGFYRVKGRPFGALSMRTKGFGRFKIGGKEFTSNTGDILFIPKDASYEVDYSQGEIIVVHFSECNYHVAENIAVENSEYLMIKFKELLSQWEEKHAVNGAKALVYKILQSVSENDSAFVEDKEFLKCVMFMNTHYAEPALDIATVCKEVYISESGVRRKFNHYFGMSPKQYLLKLRLDKAIDLLASGKHSVKEVSALCGFSDDKYFARIIKERYGQPPSSIRKKFVV